VTKNRFAKLKTLSLLEWQLLITSAILLPLTALGLHLIGLKRTHRFMKYFTSATPKTSLLEEQKLQDGRIIARMVEVAANHGLYQANCLKKSLVLWWLLKRKGITTELKIGVGKDGDDFCAHAWVELNGMPLTDPLTFLRTKSFDEMDMLSESCTQLSDRT